MTNQRTCWSDVHRVLDAGQLVLLVVGEGRVGVERDVRDVLGRLLLDLVERRGALRLLGLRLLLHDEVVHRVVLVVTDEALRSSRRDRCSRRRRSSPGTSRACTRRTASPRRCCRRTRTPSRRSSSWQLSSTSFSYVFVASANSRLRLSGYAAKPQAATLAPCLPQGRWCRLRGVVTRSGTMETSGEIEMRMIPVSGVLALLLSSLASHAGRCRRRPTTAAGRPHLRPALQGGRVVGWLQKFLEEDSQLVKCFRVITLELPWVKSCLASKH